MEPSPQAASARPTPAVPTQEVKEQEQEHEHEHEQEQERKQEEDDRIDYLEAVEATLSTEELTMSTFWNSAAIGGRLQRVCDQVMPPVLSYVYTVCVSVCVSVYLCVSTFVCVCLSL